MTGRQRFSALLPKRHLSQDRESLLSSGGLPRMVLPAPVHFVDSAEAVGAAVDGGAAKIASFIHHKTSGRIIAVRCASKAVQDLLRVRFRGIQRREESHCQTGCYEG